MVDRIQEFAISSATVEEATVAINCTEKEIAKTMAFKIHDKGILIVMAGDAKIDNPKYKAQYHTKAVIENMNKKNPVTFLLLWDLIDEMEINKKGYMQIFILRTGVNKKGLQEIEHNIL